MNKKNNRKGFTIVELVIVIAVIAILATVLVPVFGDLIADAQNSKLVQNLRNEYTSYIMENGEDVQDTVIIKMDGKYYTFTNGGLVLDSDGEPVEASEPAAGGYYWDADNGNSTIPTTAPAAGG